MEGVSELLQNDSTNLQDHMVSQHSTPQSKSTHGNHAGNGENI
jgi:hypothetical protein